MKGKLNKKYLVPLSILGAFVAAYLVLSDLGILRVYKNKTTANEPNISIGKFVVASLRLEKLPRKV